MKAWAAGVFALVMGLTIHVTAYGSPNDGFELLVPFDGAVISAHETLFVFKSDPGVGISFRLDGKVFEIADEGYVPGDDEDIHHLRLAMPEGRHVLQWYNKETEAHLGDTAITFIPPFSRKLAVEKKDTPYFFHLAEQEKRCSKCHSLPEVFETVRNRPMTPAGKVCGACHPGIEEGRQLHPPTAAFDCFQCHEPEYIPNRFSRVTSLAAVCSRCHENFLAKLIGGSKFVHGPTAVGACMICHNPHSGKTNSFLHADEVEICAKCHADTVAEDWDKSLHGSLRCSQCHDPHGGKTIMLTEKEGKEFCASCHGDVTVTKDGHPMSGHPVEWISDPSMPGRPMGCHSCHDPHSASDVSKANIVSNVKEKRRFCGLCHY